KPDIILFNYTFPTFDGPAAFKLKEKLSPLTPFIYISESVGEETAVECIKSGVSDFILKESLTTTLSLKLNRALKNSKSYKLDYEKKLLEIKRIDELGQNEAKFRAVFENSVDGILLLVTDGNLLAANPALCKMLQKTELEIINKGKDAFIDSTNPKFKLFLHERQRYGKAKAELTLVRKDGSTFPAELSSVVFDDYCGEKRTSIVFRDITMQKKAKEALKQSEKKYRKIIEMSQEGIWLFDEDQKTIFANKKMGEILEYSLAEMMGKEISFFMDEEGKKIISKLIQRKITGQTNQKQYKYISKSGKEIWANVVENPFIDSTGIYKGRMIMVTDITESKKNLEKLVQLNEELAFKNQENESRAVELSHTNTQLLKTNTELDRFVYSVSHDLRSPLTSIVGLISFIEEESLETDTLEHINMIKNSVNRLDEFIKNILSYSRNNRTGLDVVPISILQTTTGIVNSLKGMKEAGDIRFEIDIKEHHPFCSDQLRLNTLLENLISNAIKYHKTDQIDSFIKIEAHTNHDKLFLSITDNGIGIAPEHHNKIFEMFFRLSGDKNGTGIGLYIVKETIQILRGSIQVHSKEGKGSTFNITLKNLKP
ncbi:MAG: PAS domain S-box protein, partial [Flavobacterium sp.]|nr:PAS domain S-box protein [Flavobacterium sp.]